MKYQKPKGTVDFYPEELALRNRTFECFRYIAKLYNFNEIESAAFENLDLLTKKEGEEVTSQIFTLEKRGNEKFGLRFDLTIPAARMFIEKQKSLAKPVKWFCCSRMWRYEQPQKGRQREFYQFNAEIFGSNKPEADAEIISLAIDCLLGTGLRERDFIVKINNRKLLEGLLLEVIKKEKIDELIRAIDKKNKITEKEFSEELKKLKLNANNIKKINNILKIDDLSRIKTKNNLAKEGIEELTAVLKLLRNKREMIQVDLSTARGLAYYTGTVFEIFDSAGKYRALAGGGRYDNLISLLGGEKTPATGFAIGYATLNLLLEEKKLNPYIEIGPEYFVAAVNDSVRDNVMGVVITLRKRYKKVDFDLNKRGLSKQLKYAAAINAKKVIFIGPDELREGKIKVRDMATGHEKKVSLNEL